MNFLEPCSNYYFQFLIKFFATLLVLLISCLSASSVRAQSRFSKSIHEGSSPHSTRVENTFLNKEAQRFEEVQIGELTVEGRGKEADVLEEDSLLKALFIAEGNRLFLLFKCTSEEAFFQQLGAIPSTSVCWRLLPFQNPIDPNLPLRLTSPFGYRYHPLTKKWSLHKGLDFAAPAGSAVFAAGAGLVSAAGYSPLLGNYVCITHGFGWSSIYGHLSAIAVQKGDSLHTNGLLGRSGSTGRSTGPHLHFGVYYRGKPVDGLRFSKLLQKSNFEERQKTH